MIRYTILLIMFFGAGLFAEEKNGRTYKLCDVEVAKEALNLPNSIDYFNKRYNSPEAFSENVPSLYMTGHNPFIVALSNSHSTHRPFVISPDHIWLLIAQGFATHVNLNAESLRHKFVQRSGKANIIAIRNEFVKGRPDNDWESVFSEFSKQIAQEVGPQKMKLITAKFSTTTPIEQAAFDICFLTAVKNYYNFDVVSLCGIPSITIQGRPEDWKDIRARVKQLADYDLKWWTDELDPILKEFVDASEGRFNRDFWCKIYSQEETCRDTFTNGWIVKFFPYINGENFKPENVNPYLNSEVENPKEGLSIMSFSSGTCGTNFNWQHSAGQNKMIFIAGFLGYSQNKKTMALRPEIGWLVTERKKDKK